MGRSARRTYGLADVSVVPSRRTRSAKEVSTAWQLDAYRFGVPLVAHPSDAITSPAFAVEFHRLGGLAVLNAEGLIGRHRDVEEKLAKLTEVAEREAGPSAAIRMLQELHAAPLQPELLAAAVAEVRDAGVTTAVRVSPQKARELTPILLEAGIDLLVIQGTIISAEHVSSNEPLNLKNFIAELDVPVVAGGVSDHRTALHLMRTGAAGVIVGYGSSAATTTHDVLGIGVPMATAIADAAAARREYLDETGGRYVHVLADGDLYSSGDIAKAIACGADAVMLGTMLTAAKEAPGRGWYWPSVAAHPSMPRGSVVQMTAPEEQTSLEKVLNGPADDPFGYINIVAGLRRAMAKAGYSDLKEFQKVGLTVRY
ncbi:GuaB3 family IMP dehydrogenase-related protein [Hoyosella sp. YIM 151337]|uniref:GuaB3 family IMP dehydrogenase-related protein n=1 Tax=Hoyosella sp. YIM 151337 TaxID=2992742 RepID=UPI0022362756|nr:GuaB3 family IMP dehydrogenase-related protein [Hoyosella sp. YIM 151337]MCW4352502.1 GuaB3 family IMP dehydrogenase-related protein [Hoyosella sp. YIM 151337]